MIVPVDWHVTPQVQVLTSADLEQQRRAVEAGRTRETWRAFRVVFVVAGLVVLLALGYTFSQRVLNRLPTDGLLDSVGRQVSAELLRRYGSELRPLEIAGTQVQLVPPEADGRARYELVVTLRLRQPLYGPATSNGAQAYLDLQRAVADAQARLVAARRYEAHPELATPPTLPPLLTLTHRAGERREFVVPLECTQRPWSWKVVPRFDLETERTTPFTGQVMAYQPARFLDFASTDGRAQMRKLQQDARDYVLAVQRAIAAPR